jgi:hypothetical protein
MSVPKIVQTDLNIALLIGCARSGTSIFAEAVAAHPAVKYVFEPHEIWELAGHGENGSHRLTAAHATPQVCDRIRTWFAAQSCGAALVLDKTPRNALRIPFLRTVFPEAKFIHIVRDGRDVACSLMPGVGGDSWYHLKPVRWREMQAEQQPIERCALVWRDVIQTVCADLAGLPHLQVRYEELLAAPRERVADTWQFLGLPIDASALNFADKIQDATADSYHAGGQDVWYREDHARRTGRWRENLSPEQQRRVNAVLADTLKSLGYE